MLRQSLDPSKLMDPRKVLMKRYQMMGLHIGMIVALIAVSATEVRSAILLGIHGTSCLFFVIYMPRAAYLSWKRSRTTIVGDDKVKDLAGRQIGTKWDAAAVEVGYLAWQCCTTLVSGVLCTLSLRSSQCYGTSTWALDEFAEIKERDVDDWCEGVIGATVLSFIQLILDLTWLGWVVWLCRSAGDVVDITATRGSRDVETSGGLPESNPYTGEESDPSRHSTGSQTLHTSDPTHAQKVLAALHTPVPLILLKLAAHRSEQEMQRLEGIISRNRERLRRGAERRAPERPAVVAGDTNPILREDTEQGQRAREEMLIGGENVPISPVSPRDGYTGSTARDAGGGVMQHQDYGTHGLDLPPPPTPVDTPSHQQRLPDPTSQTQTQPERDRPMYREIPPPYKGAEGGAPAYITPAREEREGVFFGQVRHDG